MALAYNNHTRFNLHLWMWICLLQSHFNDAVETNPTAVRQKANGDFCSHFGVQTCQQHHNETKMDAIMETFLVHKCQYPLQTNVMNFHQAIKHHSVLLAWSLGVNVNESIQ